MAAPLDRTWFNALVDDDGSGSLGTIWNKTQIDGLLDTIDLALAGVATTADQANDVHTASANASGQVAIFDAWNSVRGDPSFAVVGPNFHLANGGVRFGIDGDSLTRTTADGADTGYIAVCGGGGGPSTRGARLLVCGNEMPFGVGGFFADIGNATGATFAVRKQNGQQLLTVYEATGLVEINFGQLRFAIENPSADPNTLDCYREGTWTPRLTADGGNSGQIYLTQKGFFTKIGRLVTLEYEVQLSNKGTMSGSIFLAGTPFLTAMAGASGVVIIDNVASPTTVPYSICTWSLGGPGWDAGYIRIPSTQNYLGASDITNSTRLMGSITYHSA